ncbi:MAG: energy-coupled thiamine transporter ThiT [Oscillospiraceae bacterium]|nr:energy-coupled thiamine transporter ThiT [Oscillospiraceae bacterium]MDD4414516.1 energy-coupled thiamine transporter ThiT [Oscillospiraceae bacterium]
MKSNKPMLLAESGIMLAFASILSIIEIAQLPYGGSITAFSMLPIIIIAYRRGAGWGLFSALAFSLVQMLMGLNNLSYATSTSAVVAIIFLDYIAAFTVLGLGGIFRRFFKKQAAGLTAGTIFVCILRYAIHVIVGYVVWTKISIPETNALIYSFVYNATYMVPETLVTVVAAIYFSRVLDIRGETITRAPAREKAPDLAVLFTGIAKSIFAAAMIADIALVFSKLQSGDTGEFDITNIANVNWPLVAGISIGAILLAGLFYIQAKRVPHDSTVELKGLFGNIPVVIVLAFAAAAAAFIIYNVSKGNTDTMSAIKMSVAAIAVIAAVIWLAISRRKRK